jgi:hypothetical protein
MLAWKTTKQQCKLSPLLKAIYRAFQQTSGIETDFRDSHKLHKFSKRIASTDKHGPIACLRYHEDWQGEWEVRNTDLETWATFKMWFGRYITREDEMPSLWTGDISRALEMKRMQQAYDRFKKTRLTKVHCRLLSNLLYEVSTGRGDWISLFVQGKRPFGNSSITSDIYMHAGWKMDWPEDKGYSDKHSERAWNIFDELAFAAPAAAKLALSKLRK